MGNLEVAQNLTPEHQCRVIQMVRLKNRLEPQYLFPLAAAAIVLSEDSAWLWCLHTSPQDLLGLGWCPPSLVGVFAHMSAQRSFIS